jgi:DNA-binding MarR family transcriptional regulator
MSGMDETSDLSKKRLGYLRALYEESQADEYKVLRTYEIAGNRAYERTLTDKIVRYLEREGLVELGSTGSQICITHAGIREVEQELAAMLGEMLVFMAQAVKDVFSADEVAEALQVRESEVTRLYRQARDQGWVKKFSDKPAMFRLTGSGAQQASRVLANRAVSSAGA